MMHMVHMMQMHKELFVALPFLQNRYVAKSLFIQDNGLNIQTLFRNAVVLRKTDLIIAFYIPVALVLNDRF